MLDNYIFAATIKITMEQMYNNLQKKAIAKIRYKFKKGYLQVSLADKKEVQRELMQVFGTESKVYFSQLLNIGIVNIRLPHYEAINHIFARRGITDVWTTEEA